MDLQTLLAGFLDFINSTVIPFILAIAFVVFIWNVVRYFIIESHSEDGREKARSLATWGIVAFVFILSIWGIVNILVDGFGFDRSEGITPDYILEN